MALGPVQYMYLINWQDSFYKSLTPEQSKKAFQNEWDFDSPAAIDFDVLVDRLRDLKKGQEALRYVTAD